MNDRNHMRRGLQIVVFGSKYRSKRLHGDVRRELGGLSHSLALQKDCRKGM